MAETNAVQTAFKTLLQECLKMSDTASIMELLEKATALAKNVEEGDDGCLKRLSSEMKKFQDDETRMQLMMGDLKEPKAMCLLLCCLCTVLVDTGTTTDVVDMFINGKIVKIGCQEVKCVNNGEWVRLGDICVNSPTVTPDLYVGAEGGWRCNGCGT